MMRRQLLALLALLCFVPAPAVLAANPPSQLMVAMRTMPAQADKFRSMMSNLNASQFHLVPVQSAMSGGEQARFEASLKKNATGITDLRQTLSHTTVTGSDGVVVPLTKILLAKNVTVDQIVGVYVGADNSITLFYQ